MKIIGVDIGGTKIEAALIEDYRIIDSHTCPTPADQPAEVVVSELVNLLGKLPINEVTGIGIGVPGLIDLETHEVFDVVHIPAWKNIPLKKIMEDSFRKPVFINNDSNCFAIGEKYFGKGKPFANFVGITLGTALGTGIIVNNRLYSGKYCGAGEFGAMFYKEKTVEDFASGLFFKSINLSGSELSNRAFSGDVEALKIFHDFGTHVGRAISFVLLALAPDAIIVGGSLSKAFKLFKKGMHSVLEHEFPYQRLYRSVKIEVSELNNSAVLGAASLVLDAFHRKNE